MLIIIRVKSSDLHVLIIGHHSLGRGVESTGHAKYY